MRHHQGQHVGLVQDDQHRGYLGTVDQDRSVGAEGQPQLDTAWDYVTTNLLNLDTGKTRTGTSTIIDQASMPGLLADAVWANQDAVFDEWSDGRARSDWTITGRRAGDEPFSVSRSNLWASLGDVTIEPAVDIAIAADSLVNNEFEM